MDLIILKFFYFHLCYKMIKYKKEQEKNSKRYFLGFKTEKLTNI